MTAVLAPAMLREHRVTYAGLAAVLIAASAVVGSSLILFAAASTGDIDVSGLGANAAAKLIGLAENGRFISAFMAVLGAFVAVLLAAQTMTFVVDGRRRELGLFRLAGASPWQTARMILTESALLGVACSIVGVLLAMPLAPLYASVLSAQNNWPPSLQVVVRPSAVIWCVVVMTLVALAGALLAARRIGRAAPIEAVRAVANVRRNMPPSRWVFAGVGLAAIGLFLLLPPERLNQQIAAAGVGAGTVLLAAALAPVIVPGVARACGGLVSLVAPGAGLVAREHAAHDARRTAALATPIIVLLGLGSVFGMMAQTGRSEKALGLEALTHTDAVVEFTAHEPGPDVLREAASLPETAAITQVKRADDWAWGEAGMPADDYPQLVGITPDTFTHFVPAQFLAGTIDDISGTDVAVLAGGGDIGDTVALGGTFALGDSVALLAPGGALVTVRVAAVVEPTSFVYGTFLVDAEGMPLGLGPTADTWLVEAAEGAGASRLVGALEPVVSPSQALEHGAWVDDTVARSVTSQQATILTIVGGAAILALFALAQSTLASVRERRDELELLTKLGARSRSVVGSVVVESGITALTGGLLAAAVAGLVYLRMATALAAVGSGLAPVVPVGLLGAVLAACIAVSALSAAVGALLALRRLA